MNIDVIGYIWLFTCGMAAGITIVYISRKTKELLLEKKYKEERKVLNGAAKKFAEEMEKSDKESHQSANPILALDMRKVSKMFGDDYDENYGKALKTTALELGHALVLGKKELELQIEKEKRAQRIS